MAMKARVEQWKAKGKSLRFNNYDIFYLQKGSGDNLLIIHGYPYSSYEWKECVEELSKTYTVTIFDLLGMGFSSKPQDRAYSFEEYCEIVNALLKHLNINSTYILSHDLGVSVAQELIAREPEGKNKFKIQSVAFVNGSLFIDVYRPRLIQKILSDSPTFIGKTVNRLISKKMVAGSVKALFGPNTQPSDEFMDEQWDVLNYNNGKAISYLIGRLVFEKYRYLDRWVRAMQQTTIPICYICGPYDPNSGTHMAERYKELIPNPQVYMLGQYIGHWPLVEDRKQMLESYYKFMSGVNR